jgi:adenosylhomocysteinase
MRDGAIVCNTGHYDVELNLVELEALAKGTRQIRENCEEVELPDGRRIYVLAKGRLVNLAAAEGHPSEVMDMSFANQFQAMVKLAREGREMKPDVYVLPEELDQEIAGLKLQSMGLSIDSLTSEQVAYGSAYSEGT